MEAKSKFARRFAAEFKDNAVALVQSGRSITEVARDRGCSTWSLERWRAIKKCAGHLSEPKTLTAETPEQRENRRLRQANDYLRRQRDLLKNALAIGSDGNLNRASNS